MDVLTPTFLRALAEPQQGQCCSIYLPTHHKGQGTWQDRVRLKNLLKEAEEQLVGAGMRSSEAREMLQPAGALTDDSEFWRYQADGLALLISLSGMTRLRLPINFSELVVVGTRFHLKPLFPMLSGDGLFYVLAISQNQARVLRCTRDSYEEIEAPEFAQGEDSILKYIEEQKQLQWHTQTGVGGPGGKRAALFHGQGAQTRHYKDRIHEYFRLVAVKLRQLMGATSIRPVSAATLAEQKVHGVTESELRTPGNMTQTPIIFVGVDYLYPIFQQAANGDLNLLDDFEAGNPDDHHASVKDIHEAARRIVEPHFDQVRQKAADLYRQARGVAPHRASNDLEEVLRTAHDGRAALSFTASNVNRWGRYDPMTGQSEFHMQQEVGDEDLLDTVTVNTFIHGGRAFVVPRDEMPDRSDAVAVTRF